MEAGVLVAEVLERSGLTKAELSRRSGVSRAQIDDYLKGKSQPSIAQLDRLSDAAGLRVDVVWRAPLRAAPEALLLVVELAEALPRRDKPPLVNLGPLWRAVRESSTEATIGG